MKKLKKLNKKTLIFVCFIILGIIIILFGIESLDTGSIKGEVEISEINPTFNTYTNLEYGFKIDFPSDWKIYENFEDVSPTINIYLPKEDVSPPFDHFADINNVSIFPKGLQTEAVIGQHQDSELDLDISIGESRDYLLEDGTIWASYINPDLEDPWKPWGFIWTRNIINNVEYKCLRESQQVELDTCNPFQGDEFVRSGDIDQEVRETAEEIVNSFRLIEDES